VDYVGLSCLFFEVGVCSVEGVELLGLWLGVGFSFFVVVGLFVLVLFVFFCFFFFFFFFFFLRAGRSFLLPHSYPFGDPFLRMKAVVVGLASPISTSGPKVLPFSHSRPV